MAAQSVKEMTLCGMKCLSVGAVGSVRQGLKESRGRGVKGDSVGVGRTGKGYTGGGCSVGRYTVTTRRRAFAVAGACGVAGLVAREGAHRDLFLVEALCL